MTASAPWTAFPTVMVRANGDQVGSPDEVDVWIGLDVGKQEHFADVLDNDGEPLFARSISNDEADLDELLDRADEVGTPGLVIDQPGSIAQLAIAVAARRGVPVAYVPGLVMRRAADLYPGEAKTDRRDAFVIADTARLRRRQVHWLDVGNDELLEQLRVLNGFDIDLAADLTRLTNRLRDALTSISPALERAIGSRAAHAGVRDLLAKYPTPTALRGAGRARITKTLKARSPRLADKITDAVTAALDAQTLTLPAEATFGRVIAELAGELDRVHRRRDTLASEIEEVFLAHPFGQLLVSLSGIGPRTGARILAEIGDGARFANGSKLASYAGLAPVTRQSGTSLKGETKSRRGNHRLKNAMFLAAFASLRDPESKTFYDRKRAEGKKHNAALICLARRRCDVILAMLRHQQPYLTPAQRDSRRQEPEAA
jgi:transposase